jgi:CheY-like chemotaxis protein
VILIVDDHADAANALARLLRRRGYQAHTLTGGQATLDYLRSAGPAPQLVILDVAMPGMDGIECLRTMKRTPSLTAIPVVMYSADYTDSQRNNAMGAGAADYIIKGVASWTDLLSSVHKHARCDPTEGLA